jgi:predicted helicase
LNHKFFPLGQNNIAIGISGLGARTTFSALAVNNLPNYDYFDKTQFFPRYVYQPEPDVNRVDGSYPKNAILVKKSNLNEASVSAFRNHFGIPSLTDDDLFHYVYAMLNCQTYLAKYATILGREMPPVPFLDKLINVRDFVDAGKKLCEIHANFGSAIPYKQDNLFAELGDQNDIFSDLNKRIKIVKHQSYFSLNCGTQILIDNVPNDALEYVVGGRSPIEWVLKRCKPRDYKASSIIDDIYVEFSDGGLDPNREYLDYLRKIIGLSIQSKLLREELARMVTKI